MTRADQANRTKETTTTVSMGISCRRFSPPTQPTGRPIALWRTTMLPRRLPQEARCCKGSASAVVGSLDSGFGIFALPLPVRGIGRIIYP
jgi:hypothetical protein